MPLAVTIIVRPQRAELVCQRLSEAGFAEHLVAAEVRGYGRQKGHLESYDGAEYRIDFLPKVLIEVVIDASDRDRVVDLVCAAARTGRIGDGKILIRRIDQETAG